VLLGFGRRSTSTVSLRVLVDHSSIEAYAAGTHNTAAISSLMI